MNRLQPQGRRSEHSDSSQVFLSQTSSMNHSQMWKSLSGKLIQQTDSTRTRANYWGKQRQAIANTSQ